MKFSNRKPRWLVLAILSLVAVLALAACQVNTPTPPVEPSPTTGALNTFDLAPTEAATAAPIVINLEGAMTTESGLQYLEETTGKGAKPKAGEIITMNYIASLPDGTELYNSYTEGKPATTVWGADRLLDGWEEGIGLMNVGSKAKLVLPPALAFGEAGNQAVPPNTQVVIEVELLKVEPAPVPTELEAEKLTKNDSGLQYYDLAEGDGEEAVKNSSVSTNYTLWVKTEDGYQYIDSSQYSSEVAFVVGRMDTVFPGWDEGTTGMKVGGKRYLVIPPDLGMGAQEGSIIPPNSTLVMEVELMSATEPRVATEVDEKDFTTTPSGLKYYDLVEGTGETPQPGQTVVVHYTGWLEDGTQFDSSVDRGQEFSFPLGEGRVIPGWDEGVSTMKVGGKRQLVIPAELGYGDMGAGSLIPPGATLIFEVELIAVQ